MVAAALLLGAVACTTTHMQPIQASQPDPYQWLEDVEGPHALAWVKAENQRTVDALAQSPRFTELQTALRRVLDSDERIPTVQKLGPLVYNFWRSRDNPRGIWRRTSLDEYRRPAPAWQTVIDVDALNKAEGKAWVWQGADCLAPAYTRCLVRLSPGGSDAGVYREFDLGTGQWVTGGFETPLSKGSLVWMDADTVLTSLVLSPTDANTSGYARVVRQWKRGTALASASTVFEAPANEVGAWPRRDSTPGAERNFVTRAKSFYSDELIWLPPQGPARPLPLPDTAHKTTAGDWLLMRLRDDWQQGPQRFAAGALLASPLQPWLRGQTGHWEVLFQPSASTSLLRVGGGRDVHVQIKDHLVVPVLDDVKHSLLLFTPTAQGWQRRSLPGVSPMARVQVSAVDAATSNALWLTTTGHLQPTTLQWMEVGAPSQAPIVQALKALPPLFDASKHEVVQHFAISKDGTRVPYFLVQSRQRPTDGRTPTLLSGYGGFEVSMLPNYSAIVGKAWLERGGAFALANIRGGGEYGPQWHQAALREKRGRSFEDFAAVAQDLVQRGITSPQHLAVRGGSNGGLLTGNMLVQYPKLIGAVVIQVPLLDMRRYNKLLAGASWMAEYGDPDKPEDWAFLQKYSPYHRFESGKSYPPTLIMTSTKDDRVHPGHARKMAALMRAHGQPVVYYENVEGGHAGTATNAQEAFMGALMYEFLWRSLSP